MFSNYVHSRACAAFQATFALAVCLAGCAPQKPKPSTAATAPVYVGEVAMVNTAAGFVLIDHGPAMSLPAAGTELVVRGAEGETARVKVTAERKRPFFTADIVSGEPAQGEKAYQ